MGTQTWVRLVQSVGLKLDSGEWDSVVKECSASLLTTLPAALLEPDLRDKLAEREQESQQRKANAKAQLQERMEEQTGPKHDGEQPSSLPQKQHKQDAEVVQVSAVGDDAEVVQSSVDGDASVFGFIAGEDCDSARQADAGEPQAEAGEQQAEAEAGEKQGVVSNEQEEAASPEVVLAKIVELRVLEEQLVGSDAAIDAAVAQDDFETADTLQTAADEARAKLEELQDFFGRCDVDPATYVAPSGGEEADGGVEAEVAVELEGGVDSEAKDEGGAEAEAEAEVGIEAKAEVVENGEVEAEAEADVEAGVEAEAVAQAEEDSAFAFIGAEEASSTAADSAFSFIGGADESAVAADSVPAPQSDSVATDADVTDVIEGADDAAVEGEEQPSGAESPYLPKTSSFEELHQVAETASSDTLPANPPRPQEQAQPKKPAQPVPTVMAALREPEPEPERNLPFSTDVVVGRCKTHLHLLDSYVGALLRFYSAGEDKNDHPLAAESEKRNPMLLGAHCLALQETVERSADFAADFNARASYRVQLWAAGFLQDRLTSPPELFYHEAHALELSLRLLHAVVQDSDQASAATASQRLLTLVQRVLRAYGAAVQELAQIPATKPRKPAGKKQAEAVEVNGRQRRASSSLSRNWRAHELHSYTRSMETPVLSALSGVATLPRRAQLSQTLKLVTPLLQPLVAHGSQAVRDSVADLLEGPVAGFLPNFEGGAAS